MSHPVAEEKRKSTRPQLLRVCMLWLVDWLGLQLDFELFYHEERVFFRMFEPIRMRIVALCPNKMATCTETVLCALKFQLKLETKTVTVWFRFNLQDKAESNFEIKVKFMEQNACEILYFFWEFVKIVYWSSWDHGGPSESSLRKQALYTLYKLTKFDDTTTVLWCQMNYLHNSCTRTSTCYAMKRTINQEP